MFPLHFNDYEKTQDRFQIEVNIFSYENKVYRLQISEKPYNQTLNLFINHRKSQITLCVYLSF